MDTRKKLMNMPLNAIDGALCDLVEETPRLVEYIIEGYECDLIITALKSAELYYLALKDGADIKIYGACADGNQTIREALKTIVANHHDDVESMFTDICEGY